MASNDELACTYSALILADDDVAITGDKIETILKASKVKVEPYWPSLFAKALEGIDIKSLVSNIGSGAPAAGGAAASSAAPAGGAAPAEEKAKVEEKKEESEEESDDDMGFGLFD